jgi:hypothetical protein
MCIFFNKTKKNNTIIPTIISPEESNTPPPPLKVYTIPTPYEYFTIIYNKIKDSNLQKTDIITQIEFYESKINHSDNKLSDIEKDLIANAVIKCKYIQKYKYKYYKP